MTRSIVPTLASALLLTAALPHVLAAQTPLGRARVAHRPRRPPLRVPRRSRSPGQYATAPADWRFPVWPSGCRRFTGDEQVACLEFVASDYGRLSRFAAANAALAAQAPGEMRVVFFGDSITDNWSKAGYGGFFPGRPYVNRGIGGQTTSQMLVRFRRRRDRAGPRRGRHPRRHQRRRRQLAGPSRPRPSRTTWPAWRSWPRRTASAWCWPRSCPVADDKKDARRPAARSARRTGPPATLRAINAWMADYARAQRARLPGLLRPRSSDAAAPSRPTSTATACTPTPRATR